MSIFAYILGLVSPAPEPTPIVKTEMINFAGVKSSGLNNLSASYLGFNGEVPAFASINWNRNIADLWGRKLKIRGVSPATKSVSQEIVDRYVYATPEKMSINEHIDQLDLVLADIKSDVDWAKICVDFKFDSVKCESFVRTSYNIDAYDLTAYSMTELMPYHDGRQNFALMELYMKNAGRNYLDVIPALGDRYLSFGRYQFTSYAVGSDADGPRSANQISNYSTNYVLPGSVSKLKGIQHDWAAYFFSVYNIAMLYKKMDKSELNNFNTSCSDRDEEIVEYIATAHHNPSWARKRALQWIDGSCSKPLVEYQGERLKTYSIKTKTNFNYIKNSA